MFFPATDAKKSIRNNSNLASKKNSSYITKLPSLCKVEELVHKDKDKQSKNKERDRDKENKMEKIAKSEVLVHNFKPRKQRTSKKLQNRLFFQILSNKIDPWDVNQTPDLDFKE